MYTGRVDYLYQKMNIKSTKIWLWGWVGFLVIGNIVWLNLDKLPPAWDQAAHLRSIVLTSQWLRGQFWGNFSDLIKSFGGYPPLIYFIGGLMGYKLSIYLNTIFLIAGIIGVYKLALIISKDKQSSLISAVIFSLFPVIYDISRNMLLDLPLLVWVVWGLYFMIKKKESGVLVMLILGSLTKLNGFLYFGPMVLFLVIENYKEKQFWMRAVIGAAIYSMAVGWWWILNFSNIYNYLTGLAGSGEKLTDPMNLLDWQTWIHYFRLFFQHQVGPITALVFLIFSKKENKKLIWWTILTYVVFTIIKNKDFRFTMPLLVPVAVWIGWGINPLPGEYRGVPLEKRGLKKVILIMLLVWLGFNYVENSFNWPFKKPVVVSTPTFLIGDINWINFSDYPVREYRQSIWPQKEIMETIAADWGNDSFVRVLMLMNIAELNDNNLRLESERLEKSNIEIRGVFEWNELDFSYIILPDLETTVAPFYDVELEKRNRVVKEIFDNRDKYEWLREFKLPNGGRVYLVKPLN